MAGFLPCCAAAVKSDEPVLTKAEAIRHLNGKTADICMPEIRTKDLPSEDVILKMKNVSFGYDRNKGLIIDDLNLEITGGSIVSLLGENGCGKSTQIRRLCDYLTERGELVLLTREPGGCPISERIREIILSLDSKGMSAECEALLYAASRVEHVKETILPAIERGEIVLCDRYLDSSFAYQASGRELGDDFIRQI